jgi:hypothetical protein
MCQSASEASWTEGVSWSSLSIREEKVVRDDSDLNE